MAAATAMNVDDQGMAAAANGQARLRCMSSYVDEGSVQSHRYYLARRTLLEMLRDRGYAIPSSDIDVSLADFRATHGQSPDIDRLRISNSLRSDPSKRVLVYFCNPGPVKVNSIRYISGQIANKDGLSGLILVLQGEMTNQALKALDLFPFKVQVFQITDLLVNITKHVLKPKHRVLTDQEKQRLLKKYSIQEKQLVQMELQAWSVASSSTNCRMNFPIWNQQHVCFYIQLPRMLKTDAIARYYGLEKGQVVKVTYSGDITGTHVTYRCVW